jgi:hypothetical protein
MAAGKGFRLRRLIISLSLAGISNVALLLWKDSSSEDDSSPALHRGNTAEPPLRHTEIELQHDVGPVSEA